MAITERYSLKVSIAEIKVEEYLHDYSNIPYFLSMCQQCSSYSKRWCCPPFSFDIKSTLSQFTYAHIIGVQILFSEAMQLEAESLGNGRETTNSVIGEVWRDVHPKLLKLRTLYSPSIAFSIGCHLCEGDICSRVKGEACLHPDKMLYSLESFGFDVAKTARQLLDIELLWSKDKKMPEYLTLIFGLFTNDKIEKEELNQLFA